MTEKRIELEKKEFEALVETIEVDDYIPSEEETDEVAVLEIVKDDRK